MSVMPPSSPLSPDSSAASSASAATPSLAPPLPRWRTRFGITTMDRYILGQVLDYFLLGVVVFTLVIFFSDTFLDFVGDIRKLGMPTHLLLIMVGLHLPKTIAFVLPASVFMAVMMVYNAMNHAFEMVALRTNGVSLRRLLAPALLVGVLASGLAYFLGDVVVPYSNRQTLVLKQQALLSSGLPSGMESFTLPLYNSDGDLQKLIYVSRFEGKALGPSTVIDLSQRGMFQITQAHAGTWEPGQWRFTNANVYTMFKNKDVMASNHQGRLIVRDLVDPGKNKVEGLMDWRDPLNLDSGVQNFRSLFSRIRQREALGMRVTRNTYVNLWEKITLPLSCLIMLLTAVPLALSPPRSASNRGFMFSIGVLFLYYLLRSVFVAWGRSGVLSLGGLISTPIAMMLACWLPLALIAALGLFLLFRKSRVL